MRRRQQTDSRWGVGRILRRASGTRRVLDARDHGAPIASRGYWGTDGGLNADESCAYDVFDRRIGQQVDGNGDGTYDSTERYVYDGGGSLLLTLSGTGAITHAFLNGPAGSNQVLADDAGGSGVTWLLADRLGSVKDVINSAGTRGVGWGDQRVFASFKWVNKPCCCPFRPGTTCLAVPSVRQKSPHLLAAMTQ